MANKHCADKNRLLAAYNDSVNEWSDAVRSPSNHAGSAGFAILMSQVEQARTKTKRAKSEYAAHVAEHGC
jgi:hypothetical protein